MGPKQYQFRLPFFGTVLSDHEVAINGGFQKIIDLEISLASYCGLDYWAFDAYARDSGMSRALNLYLASSLKTKIGFCMLCGLGLWGYKEESRRTIDWHAELMSDSSYQRVDNNRPLYFFGFLTDSLIRERWGGVESIRSVLQMLREKTVSRGQGQPYIVILDEDPKRAFDFMTALGGDAISNYGVNFNLHKGRYSELAREAAESWDAQARYAPVVPTMVTGFDRRPRFEHPVPWEKVQKFPDIMDVYYETAKPGEIRDHIIACLDWMLRNPTATPAKTALIYAWNENDEGGWLIPTYGDGLLRINAVREALDAGGSLVQK